MRRLAKKLPSYRLHRATKQAVVTLDGRDHYLGPHGTATSRAEYDRLIAEWLAHGRRLPGESCATVNELILAYWRYAEAHYTRDGKPTLHLNNIKDAIRPLRKLYGHTRVDEFGAAAIKTLRKALIRDGLSRNTINGRIGKLRSLFRWAVEERLVPANVLQEICSVRALKPGRDGVRETEPVKPVAEEHINAVLPHVSAPIRAMVQLQRLAGMRPGEVVVMRGVDIDRSGDIWIYAPKRHKTDHLGQVRSIFFGPRAQEVLAPWLADDPEAYIFSPRRAEEMRSQQRRAARKTPMTPSQRARQRKKNPKRTPQDHYHRNAYANAIAKACKKAGIPAWRPNRLRHVAATEIRKRFGLEAAQSVLGHKHINTTETYAEPHLARAREVMRQLG